MEEEADKDATSGCLFDAFSSLFLDLNQRATARLRVTPVTHRVLIVVASRPDAPEHFLANSTRMPVRRLRKKPERDGSLSSEHNSCCS